jgi:hypothetical protein
MKNFAPLSTLFLIFSLFAFNAQAAGEEADLNEAISLLQQTHADQCRNQKIKGQLMLAHREHDQAKMQELWPQADEVSKRLKPSEDRLRVLKANIKKNQDLQNAFEQRLLAMGECD